MPEGNFIGDEAEETLPVRSPLPVGQEEVLRDIRGRFRGPVVAWLHAVNPHASEPVLQRQQT